ncbi:hypothetical protein AAZX31_10G232200 [Glycine max]|uniref:EGF-like domain-containing protein n=2 Tax=Glycine subgen. Soja TaxID=1462606 RepID=K7LL76_SOYBN|nr:protein lin-12-like [Glycine soja]XP_040861872.1 protein lin-12 isoform X1 [Glycine max]KAG4998330.1 hypothetical protein JHK85_029769 [Glycine max]KAG5005086.1 hypothetical protein JHK86_029225 [Glycine max]KAG5128281.1 hypothetical protein JHK82_029116 [Glycine max]KAG5152886.1 hypothetical protein JHK84_029358 [Glycine max]KAH1139911.1 hypothetical protein GYH30_029005 [Glycine max]|eukprot:XP_025979953.1 protein lin-12 [Glycine max]
MAFASAIAFLLLHTLSSVRSDFLSPLSPLVAPLYEDVCKKVECGKGTCKPSQNSTLLFECHCHPGWRQTLSAHDEGFKFLPCIVPNCTMDSSCSNAPAPAQQERKANESIFDACHWVDCGGGSCNKTSLFSYSCNCDAGYYNLLNATALPCFRECAIGFGCSNLGISMTNSSTASPPPPLNENASLILKGSSPWLLVLIIFIANMQLQ